MFISGSMSLLMFAFLSFAATAADDLKAFPPAESGLTRSVIRLSRQKDETAFMIELIVGKKVKTDSQNQYFFAGKLLTESIPGWGYNRYILRDPGPMAGTLMAVDPAAPLVERFVSLGQQTILPYNSRLPFVVYVPDGMEVRYRVWRAGPILLPPSGGR